MLPDPIKAAIEAHLGESIITAEPLFGGDINKATKIVTASGEPLFLKWNAHSPMGMFEAEAKGLNLLSSAATDFLIPKVHLVGKDFLLMEFIEEGSDGDFFDFGVQLAHLHKKTNEFFGLDHANYIGRMPQSNTYYTDWMEFFMCERLEPQVKAAIDAGKINKKYITAFERSFNYTYVVFPEEPPALLHGDLWGGNFMFSVGGRACIYDPAVYFGHREMDIAMSTLFGGFAPDFYNGYNEEYSLEPGYEERLKLCNLYPLLVHANLFGGGYISQVEALIQRFF